MSEKPNRLARAADMANLTAGEIGKVTAAVSSRGAEVLSREAKIEVPETIEISKNLGIMEHELTVGQLRQFVEESGYKIEGHNAEKLRAVLDDPSQAGKAVTFVHLHDGKAFAKWLSEKTGRKFRLPTEPEWEQGQAKGQLSGENWVWTETEISDTFVLRRSGLPYQNYSNPSYRFNGRAIVFVEDK
ncbi:MAG: SUMF1/EgtB/PvdO family nonheme iron enzyme [Candidatus Margulisiibacteriota bacterium]|nr:SUMF1/EgtB/PvdO family nonheme iron enzyme [Candidatus Margulisiibacteriota bacterium]